MSQPRSAMPGALAALFLVSAGAIGFEIALTRFFAVALWSEYGYWVISIAMAGFAFAGMVLALGREALARRGAALLAGLPAALTLAAAVGFHFAVRNRFNPLALQNPVTWAGQLWHIGAYYAALLPFFLLAGLFVGLCFVLAPGRIGAVYGADLIGAGAGAAAVLGLMFVLPPFRLVPALLALPAAAALFAPAGLRRAGIAASVAALLAGEALLLAGAQPRISEFKPIYAPLHTPGARVLATVNRPTGTYALLGDFTERVDTDVSNDAGMLGLPGPPRSLGLYRDGDRIAGLPRPPSPRADAAVAAPPPSPLSPAAEGAARRAAGEGAAPPAMPGAPPPVPGYDVGYAAAGLDALPYRLLHAPRVLLIGASGGFRIAAALALGARHVTALEPEPVLLAALRHGLGPAPRFPADPRVRLRGTAPLAAVLSAARRGARYDLIDLSADFLDAAPGNQTAFTVAALAADLRALAGGGILSVPVSIRDFPVYALRVLATGRAALRRAGVAGPMGAHAIVYRSAWSTRVLLSPRAFTQAAIARARAFCDRRSFDVSWYPGIDVAAARAGIYNDLPPISFAAGTVRQGGPDDSIADEAGAVLAGRPSASAAAFSLAPETLDRPFFYAALRLGQLGLLLRRLEVLPQPEIGALVNLAVLAQAGLIALVLLALPLVAPRLRAGGNDTRSEGQPGDSLPLPLARERSVRAANRVRAGGTPPAPTPAPAGEGGLAPPFGLGRVAVYFSSLGLGFLFIEIALIAQASLWLDDPTSGFALVLTGMLVFSGLGALTAGRVRQRPWRAMALAVLVVAVWTGAALFGLRPLLLATLGAPWALRAALVLAVTAPVGIALGLPFPLGLDRIGRDGMPHAWLPWAWGLNGAFSVLASPLATLIAREAGYSRVLLGAAILYAVAVVAFPAPRSRLACTDLPVPLPAAD